MDSGAQMEFVPRPEGQRVALRPDRQNGTVIVEGQSASPPPVKQMEASGTGFVSVPEDFLVGRVIAQHGRPDTGEIVAKANDS